MANLWEGSGQVLVDGETAPSDPKERRRIRERKRYSENKEARAAYAANYREKNSEKVRAYSRKSYQQLKAADPTYAERHSRRSIEWRNKNRERVRELARIRWASDPEFRAKSAAKQKANRDKFSEYARKSRAKNYVWNMVRNAEARAKREGLNFDLTREWAESRWTGKCELTGIEFSPRLGKGRGTATPFSPSLDKIDPSKGYVQDNCRFILWAVNRFKGKDSDEIFMQVARALVNKENSNG